jgi:sRNA-binding regulator protein Hfq
MHVNYTCSIKLDKGIFINLINNIKLRGIIGQFLFFFLVLKNN